jgi:uncharacterized Fe-S cluster-containing protein
MSQDNLIDTKGFARQLPGLDCGLCGSRSCADFAAVIAQRPEELARCIHLKKKPQPTVQPAAAPLFCPGCAGTKPEAAITWKDSLGREFDFVLDSLSGEPGPREIILPHNPARTRELDVQKGDILIGRPMGMSCGCPITHCGVAMEVDPANGVISWCVTGPLNPRAGAHKDLGYYSAQAYEGMVAASRDELKIGMRYWFMPHRCMLQWRHSGLVNFLNRGKKGLQVRVEGLFIG